jgi:hypothetical protein
VPIRLQTSTYGCRILYRMPESLESVDHVTFHRVWQVICEIGKAERHFNSLQRTYRALASTWLLAAFGAAGFVLEKLGNSSIPRPSLLAAIGLAAGTGIILLWTLDLLVYHRLLDCNFAEGLRLEEQYPWLPQVRQRMMAVHKNEGVLPRVVWFYAVTSSIMLLTGSGSLFYWLLPFGLPVAISLAAFAAIGTLAFEAALIRRTNAKPPTMAHSTDRSSTASA